jgi:hypothetical protein
VNSTDLLKSHEVILYGPPKASASTMSWSGVTASAEKTSSSTIAREAREDEREDLVVVGLQLEDDGRVIRRLDAVEVVEQARRAVGVGDLQVAVERELHVRARQVVAVGPLQARRELHGVLVGRGELGGLGEVGDDLGGVVVGVDEVREDLRLHGERAVVVRAGRVERRDLVGGADDDRLARSVAAAGGAAGRAAAEQAARRSVATPSADAAPIRRARVE